MGYSEDLDFTEIAEKLHEQVRANDVLNRSVVRQEEEIKKLKARIMELETGQKPIAKTSANSSMPPSKNPVGVPHTQSRRRPSGKKSGGQKGHPGSTRLQTDNVTATERWYPAAVCPVCGKNNWLWAFQNGVATYLAFDSGRSHGAITDNFTPKELEGKVWVTDRWPAYFMGDVGMENHQICLAHLLRNLIYTMQAFPDDEWSLDMLDLLRNSVHHRN